VIYSEVTPEELLSEFTTPRITGEPWVVRWDKAGDSTAIEELVLKTLPPTVEFHTSGTTGPSKPWLRTREYLWAEAGMLADLLRSRDPQAAMSFVPPSHLYGALSSMLVPARLGIPAWFRPQFAGALPPAEDKRWAVMAIPWIFSLLRRYMAWVDQTEQVTVLHASGMLPSAAGDFLAEAGDGRALVVEVFGATESGGVATRRWGGGDLPPWELFPDVSFASPPSTTDTRPGAEVPLAVRSPRIAFQTADGRSPESWELDDYVEPIDDRRFLFTGRRSRIVNINGRRINLDQVEDALQSVLVCTDLALFPVSDAMIGEHVELLVVLDEGTTLADLDLTAAFKTMTVRPRQVRVVGTIDRSEVGKARRVQPAQSVPAQSSDAGADR
jgi:acyl-coenzyme A synthetase/AMP-(fatty) acid ligase